MSNRIAVTLRVSILAVGVLVGSTLATAPVRAQVLSDSTYAVQSGDTLFSIAQQFGVSVRALKAWNGLESDTLHEGQVLRVRPPVAGHSTRDTSVAPDTVQRSTTTDSTTATPPRPYGHYAIDRGDSFVTLALRLGTTADSLFALNDKKTRALLPGQTIRLPRRFGPPTHVVETEETLYSIAGQYGVSVRALRASNDLDSTTITPGQRLRLPTAMGPKIPPKGQWAAPDSTGPITVYPEPFEGRLTASGTPYDPNSAVVSHPSLPYGSVVLLSIPDTDRHAFARVIDRGPVDENVLMDVSQAVGKQLGIERGDRSTVGLRTIWVSRSER